jgi:hypothetical protein
LLSTLIFNDSNDVLIKYHKSQKMFSVQNISNNPWFHD